MDKVTEYIKFCQKWEGSMGKSKNDPASAYPCPTPYNGSLGWHTVKGVTYQTWVNEFGRNCDERFFAMSDEDWFHVFKKRFFNVVKAGEMKDFRISAIVTEIGWMSGPGQAGRTLQTALCNVGSKVVVDGSIGNKTIEAVNTCDNDKLFNEIYVLREKFYRQIATGKKAVFLNGWLNRLNQSKAVFSKFK